MIFFNLFLFFNLIGIIKKRAKWNRLPREAVDGPSLEASKAGLNAALGSLSWWAAALPTAEGRNWMIFKVFPNKAIL